MKTYSTFQTCEALDILRERLKDWQNGGFVQPSIPAQGKGTKAAFSLVDVYAVALFKHLVEERHFSRKEASNFSRAWLAHVSSWLDRIRVEAKGDAKEKEKKLVDAILRLGNDILIFVFADEGGEKRLLYTSFSFHGEQEKFFEDTIKRVKDAVDDKRWSDVLVVNFPYLKKRVDAALARV